MITRWMKLGGNLPPGHDDLLTLFNKRHGILYMPSESHRISWTYWSRPLFTQSWTTGGKSNCSGTRHIRTANLSVHSRTRQPPDEEDKSDDQIYPGSSIGGGLLQWPFLGSLHNGLKLHGITRNIMAEVHITVSFSRGGGRGGGSWNSH